MSQAVDDQNVPGFQYVDRLAAYLVGLRDQTSLCLTNQQADTIIGLWKKLDDRDRQRVVYMARHQERLLSGRFRVPKKPSSTPGVESTTRCVLGAGSAPAQWPDCCRLVEAVFIRLCVLHPAPVRRGSHTDSRWSLILRDYHNIRQLVVSNALVMQQTNMQLVMVNQTTLTQWHNKRQKRQEVSVLLQGTNLPEPPSTSEQPLPEARSLLPAPMVAQQEHQYRLPENTAGQARTRQRVSCQQSIRPKAPIFVAPATPGLQTPVLPPRIQSVPVLTPRLQAAPVLTPSVQAAPVLTPWQQAAPVYRPTLQGPPVLMPTPQAVQYVPVFLSVPQVPGISTLASAPAQTAVPKRAYKRTVEANTCKKCGQFRTAETGHSQYHGKVYCPNFETLSKQQWLEEMRKGQKEADK